MKPTHRRFLHLALTLQIVLSLGFSFGAPAFAAEPTVVEGTVQGPYEALCPQEDFPAQPEPQSLGDALTPDSTGPIAKNFGEVIDAEATPGESWPITEPAPCDTPVDNTKDNVPPTITDLGLFMTRFGLDHNILGDSNHISPSTGRPVIGNIVSVGGTFADNFMLTNVLGGVSGVDFFGNNDWTPYPTNNNSWNPVPQGPYHATWDTAHGAGWQTVADGNYTIFLNARDRGVLDGTYIQNNTYQYIDVTVDNTAPTGNFTNGAIPADFGTVRGNVDFSVHMTDANGFYKVTTGIIGKPAACESGLWPSSGDLHCVINTADYTDGIHVVQTIGYDKAGNGQRVLSILYFDNTAPTLPVHLSPANGSSSTTANQQLIDWTDSTDANGVAYYLYESSHSPILNDDGSFASPVYQSGQLATSQIATPGTPEGGYYWHVMAVDVNGNATPWTSAWKINVDNTAPATPVLVTPADGSVLRSVANITQSWLSISGTYAGFEYQTCAVDPGDLGGECSTVIETTTVTTPNHILLAGQADGHYWWRVRAYDAAGNWSGFSNAFEITLDTTAPAVTVNAPTSPTTNTQPTLTGNANDILSGVASAQFRIINTADSSVVADWATLTLAVDGSFSFTPASALAVGSYRFEVRATDQVGNEGAASRELTVQAVTVPAVVTSPTPTPTATPAPQAAVATATPVAAQTTAPAPTATPTTNEAAAIEQPATSPTPEAGEVKAAETESGSGMAWYWWILIVAAILGIFWFLLGKRRKEDEEN